MADALCGPSNPLQNFQKHTQADRTLQQDRLISRQSPSQGFRSAALNDGLLDPEFEAFQAGVPVGLPEFQAEPLRPFVPPHIPQHQIRPSPSLGDWASDFQQLHISPVRPVSAQQQPTILTRQAPLALPKPAVASSWHTDFMQSTGMLSYHAQPAMQPQLSWAPLEGMNSHAPSVSQGKQRELVTDNEMSARDMHAFEQAFDAAREELMQAEAERQAESERQVQEEDMSLDEVHRELQEETNHLAALEQSRMANWPDPRLEAPFETTFDGIPRETVPLPVVENAIEQERQPVPRDDDELSEVAGQLLDSVSHETSEKFQSSVFLQLMRRLRDKEVRVEGENFVETGTTSPAPLSSSNIPTEEQDLDTGRYSSTVDTAQPTTILSIPSRPLTPEIDPPAPTLAQWRQRLLGIDSRP